MSAQRAEAPPITYHLAPRDVWQAQASATEYLPEAYEVDGFIHCTDGEAEVINVGNRYYQGDTRDYVVLTIDRDRVRAPVRYEDPGRIYPHIYGPLNLDAVIEIRPARRDPDGRFIAIGE